MGYGAVTEQTNVTSVKSQKGRSLIEETLAERFPHLLKTIDPQIQDVQGTPN